MKKVYIFTGPPGVGKNTIAELWAKKKKKSVVIDVDIIRWMLRNPHKAPWEGSEGKRQQMLGVQNTCLLAKNFLKDNYSVIILDVLSGQTAHEYRQKLKEYHPVIVLLWSDFKEVRKRNAQRPPKLKDREIKIIYNQQRDFTDYDIRIDNSKLKPKVVIKQINV